MATIQEITYRVEQEYLEPIIERSASVPITQGISNSATSVVFDAGVLSPDEESILGPGTVLELDAELVFVTDYDASTRTVTVQRGWQGTTPAAYPTGEQLRFPTRWPRHLVIDAIRDAIDNLYPPLYIAKEQRSVVSVIKWVELPADTVVVHSVRYQYGNRWVDTPAELFTQHPDNPDVAGLQVPEALPNSLCVIRYGVRVSAPESVDDEIVDLPDKWVRLIMVDVAANLLSGVDIDAVSQEYITEQLRLERFPVRSGESIQRALITVREYLMERFRNEQKALTPPPVRRLDVVEL